MADGDEEYFDIDRFILEVKCRDAIWNTTTEAYLDKDLKKKCWLEIVEIFLNKEDATEAEINNYAQTLQKRWKNLRDCFVRSSQRKDKNKVPRQDASSSEDSSSSSEDDENAELLTEELEEGFFKVLSRLKKKDSKLYEESVKYFPTDTPDGNFESNSKERRRKKKSLKKYREWLKGQENDVENEDAKEDLEALHDFWTNPTLNKDEQFLRDYILNQKFLEPDETFNIKEEINKVSDEEKEVEEQIAFEHKYNCRFENQDQDLIDNNKPKAKCKKNKPGKGSLDSNEIISKSENRESSENEVDKEPLKKRRKKKRSHNLEGQIISEGSKKYNEMKREEVAESLLTENHISTEKVNDKTQIDKSVITVKNEDEKSRKEKKRKMPGSIQGDKGTPTLNISSEVIQPETNHPKKKFNKKKNNNKNLIGAASEKQETVKDLSENMHNLPRNLQMKNKKGKKKMRHRNKKKALWKTTTNTVSVQTEGKYQNNVSLHTVGTSQKRMEKKRMRYNKNNAFVVGGKKKGSNLKSKNKHFQSLIVKEKKEKESRFSKIHSKKQKAANAVCKR